MPTILATLCFFALIFGITFQAFAQDESQESGDVVYEDETVYNFDAEFIDGNVQRPDGELIQGQRHGKESSLIPIRSDFIPELIESVEDLPTSYHYDSTE